VIVLDASALVDFLLGRDVAIAAVLDGLAGREQGSLHAPELIEPEALNALRRLTLNGLVTEQRAADAVADLVDVRLVRYPHAPLRERVWALRHSLTAYDATYLALAEALSEPVLITGDHGLAAIARRWLGEHGVRELD
jgi:predicted nucleic acid-binding protein